MWIMDRNAGLAINSAIFGSAGASSVNHCMLAVNATDR